MGGQYGGRARAGHVCLWSWRKKESRLSLASLISLSHVLYIVIITNPLPVIFFHFTSYILFAYGKGIYTHISNVYVKTQKKKKFPFSHSGVHNSLLLYNRFFYGSIFFFLVRMAWIFFFRQQVLCRKNPNQEKGAQPSFLDPPVFPIYQAITGMPGSPLLPLLLSCPALSFSFSFSFSFSLSLYLFLYLSLSLSLSLRALPYMLSLHMQSPTTHRRTGTHTCLHKTSSSHNDRVHPFIQDSSL